MLFNSLEFFVFFAVVYSLYLVLNHRLQNRMLLVASYVFYGAWDWRFLSLIFTSTVLDYFCGLKIHESDNAKKRKLFLFFSVAGNLSILGFFKYYNFFIDNMQTLLSVLGLHVRIPFIEILLPIGISFYTFQTMSYTIDIYRRQMAPTRKFLDFALFVAFFPQLVAGPIERARNLLPQILTPRNFNRSMFYEGCYLIFWGLFQKAVVADNLARLVDPVISARAPYQGFQVLLAVYAFTFQIFCDFAGYSNIARGLGKCMGFDIMVNFNLPFFVTNIQEYWQKWHISLSSWIRDYLYFPLFGRLKWIKGNTRIYITLLITMSLMGLWHGSAWTYVLWGLYHGILLVLYVMVRPWLQKRINPVTGPGKTLWKWVRITFMFHVTAFGMLIFRAQSFSQVMAMFHDFVFNFNIGRAHLLTRDITHLVFFSCLLVTVQFYQYFKEDLMAVYRGNVYLKSAFYLVCLVLFLFYGINEGKEFIYFQF